MRYLGIDVPDVNTFFNMLGGVDAHGNVKIDRCVESCMRLRGEAKSIQLNQLLYEVKSLDLQGVYSQVSAMRHDLSVVMGFFEGLSAAAPGAEESATPGENAGRAKPIAAFLAAADAGIAAAVPPDTATPPTSPGSAPAPRRNGQMRFCGRPTAASHSCLPLLP
ncbi:unnamed protein product [Prorocentrum cordatum]|uniref:Uncharacterized protein n=1 Tax=Prorocentrum cordatum TaxID=2364126 RepID=A0ABN9UGJ6_9DINO|nr:unnamed protein product [Polarella glacialis]